MSRKRPAIDIDAGAARTGFGCRSPAAFLSVVGQNVGRPGAPARVTLRAFIAASSLKMHLSRFTSLIAGSLVAALLLTFVAAVTGITSPVHAFVAGFISAFVAIVVARMLEPVGSTTATPHALREPAAPMPAAMQGKAAKPATSDTRERATTARSPSRAASSREELPAANGERMSGTVKWFNRAKGYGFIHCDDDREVFVHHRNLRGDDRQTLQDGERVSFHVVERSRGPQAEDVAAETQ